MSHTQCLLVACCLALCATQAVSQDKTKPGDEMIYKYLCAEADKLSAKFMDGAKTLADWQQKRPRLYREYMDMLGLWPLPEKTPLKATITGSLEAHGVVVEKLHFQSKPGLYVTANVFRPKDVKGKRLPAILYVCGHSGAGRDGGRTMFQDHGFWFANNGYICIIVDTLQLGEIPGIHHGTYGLRGTNQGETRFWWHSRGYTPAGVECWNGVRAIDYLVTRPDVDPEKIGVTGISGGGAATFWIAAADDRVKVAVPVSGMSDLESYVKNKVINGHCDCMFLYNTYQWDWTTIAAMIAPRPMLFANSDMDPIFPMDGNRRIIAKLRDCYKMHGQPDLVDEYVSKGGHAYRPDLRNAIFKFINKHLKGDTTSPVEDAAKYTFVPGKDLRVFPTDEDLPKDRLNGKIDQTFVARAQVKLPEKGKFEEWRNGLLGELKQKVFRDFTPIPPAKLIEAGVGHGLIWLYGTESGLPVYFGLPIDAAKGRTSCTIIVQGDWPKDDRSAEKVLLAQEELWKKHLGGDLGLNVWPRGVAITHHYLWSTASPPNFVERAHVLVGQKLDAKRVWDVISLSKAIQAALSKDKNDKGQVQRFGGSGREGILAAYAALFEPSIKEVIVINPPKSHMEGPHFLNVLRVLDIPEALGLLAPRPLTIIGGNDPAFDRTAEIYRLAGAADKLTRK